MDIPSNLPPSNVNTMSGQSGAALAKNFDTFLQLLTAQMQNQDPLQPMDNQEFTQQLVQFTGVEQSIAMNQNLELMLGMMLANHSTAAVGYIGKQVSADTATAALDGGEARWSYELPGDATQTTITITDANGKVVFETNGELTAGNHEFVWDGNDNNGNPLPGGDYTIEVAAVGANDESLGVTTSISGIVTGVEMEGGEPMLLIGDTRVPLSAVRQITEAPQAA